MNDWLILAVVYLTLFVSSPLIAILHELGHAFAYLILTKPDNIDIYIGTYSQPKNGIHFKTGKINFYIKRSFPFVKGIGLCKSSKPETDYLNYIIILLAGTVFTLFAAALLSIIAFNANAHLLVQISCYIFLGLSVLSLINNLVPRNVDMFYNKISLNSDGKQLAFVMKLKTALPDYIEAREHYYKNEFEQAKIKLKEVLVITPSQEDILRLLVATTIALKQYKEAANYAALLEENGEQTIDDLLNKGYLQSVNHQHHEAILTYQKALKKDRNNLIALSNIGYELIEEGAHEVALRALEKAIKLDPKFYLPYSNLGYSKILQNELDAGKVLIDKSLELNDANADAYKALGIYHLKLKDINQAQTNFNKAAELDKDIDLSTYTAEIKLLQEQVANI